MTDWAAVASRCHADRRNRAETESDSRAAGPSGRSVPLAAIGALLSARSRFRHRGRSHVRKRPEVRVRWWRSQSDTCRGHRVVAYACRLRAVRQRRAIRTDARRHEGGAGARTLDVSRSTGCSSCFFLREFASTEKACWNRRNATDFQLLESCFRVEKRSGEPEQRELEPTPAMAQAGRHPQGRQIC
jgi:hypothetical protein